MTTKVLVIAEGGVNHNGDVNLAKQLVHAARDAGADVVKFQTFSAEQLVTSTGPKAKYQLETTGSSGTQFEMLRNLELSFDAQRELLQLCNDIGIQFLSTPFDMSSLAFLTSELGLHQVKVSSSDLTNIPMLIRLGIKGTKVILSTGMGSLAEIEHALTALWYGHQYGTEPENSVSIFAHPDKVADSVWLRDNVTLLHCTTQYPASVENVNLRAMVSMGNAFGLRVGYSDHTTGLSMALAAVALGAEVIEKHLTLDKSMEGPDHAASCEPADFKTLVQGIRDVELGLGRSVKAPMRDELQNRFSMRKSVHLIRDLAAGQEITSGDLALLRPEEGLPPSRFYDVLGECASKNLKQGPIEEWPV